MHPPESDPACDHGPNFAGERSALDWAHQAGATEEVLAELNRRSRRRRVRTGIVAGLGVLALGFFIWPASRPLVMPPAPAAPVGTIAIDEPPQQRLSDGTVVDLQEGAVVEEAFTPATRRVVLRQGTAHFQVVKNPARPFVVEADGLHVRAVGTAFTVTMAATGIEVLVTEGRVAVGADPLAPEATASAGERVRMEPGTGEIATLKVTAVPSGEIAERMAWRQPRLRFADAPLVEAVKLINRHNRRQLVIEDEALGALQISGVLRADNQPAFLEALRLNFGIEAVPVGECEIHLQRRTAAIIN